MADKEKVINGLKHCTSARMGCFECPYSEDGFSAKSDCKLQIDRDALELLEHAIIIERSWVCCRDCKYWDFNSGLTARRCDMHDIITKQSDWCNKAVKWDD